MPFGTEKLASVGHRMVKRVWGCV